MFSSLLARFFPVHTWGTESNEEQRTCQVCGRVEHYEDTDGWVAPGWRAVRSGDKRAHVAAAKLASAKGQPDEAPVIEDETTQPQPASLA
jgi:hypothetical protein